MPLAQTAPTSQTTLLNDAQQRLPRFWASDTDWSPYDRETFESALGRYFRSERSIELAGTGRWIYLMERRQGGDA